MSSHFHTWTLLLIVICCACVLVESKVTPAENVALTKLRTIIKDEDLNLDYMKKDEYLLSWLRKHKFDVQTTSTRIRKALQWRKENNIDNLLNEDFSIFTKNYPFDVDGVDRQGRPIWFFQIGKWDLRRIHLSGQHDKFSRYRLYLQELISKKMRDANEKNPDHINGNDGYLAIVDLGGFNLRQHGCIRCLQDNIKFDLETEAAYPDKPYKSIMVNAPTVFEAFYRTIKSLLPERTFDELDNIDIYDFDQQKWKKALLTYAAPDQLPIQYGGTRKTTLL